MVAEKTAEVSEVPVVVVAMPTFWQEKMGVAATKVHRKSFQVFILFYF
jgi:hypothetical protein